MEKTLESIAQDLLENNISIKDGLFDQGLIGQLQDEALKGFKKGAFKKAKIGKGIEKQRVSEIRGDEVKWLNRDTASTAQLQYWTFLDVLREYLSNYFRIHLERCELHLAVYPPGSFYAKHLDQFQGSTNRIFSVILYLNLNWQQGDGAELRVYPKGNAFQDIAPLANRLVIFRSDILEHEVLLSKTHRLSVTGWMRKDVLIL